MGDCVESGWATFSWAIALAGFAIRPGWRGSLNLAATEGFGAFRARGAVFGVDAGATAAGVRNGKGGAAAACAGASEGRSAASGEAAEAVSAFLGSGKVALLTGSACIWVAAGDAGAPTVWFSKAVSPCRATAGGVSAGCRDASTSCSASPPDVAGGGLTDESGMDAFWAGASALVATCDGGLANAASALIDETSGGLEASFQEALLSPRPASPAITIPPMT